MPLRYRIVRWLLRIWFAAVFRKVRLLGAEDEAGSSATVLLVSHPPRLLDALLLVASFDRQLHCLIDPKTISGPARQLLAWSLGMIPDTPSDGVHPRAGVEACHKWRESGGTLVVFAKPEAENGNPSNQLMAVARMALEVESTPPLGTESALLAVQLLIPFARFNEALIHFGEPVLPRDFLPVPGSTLDPQVTELALELSRACQVNPFALRQDDLVRVLADLAEILRSDLADEWASKPNWKQSLEGFTLSRFVAEWAEQANRLDPDRLVSIREALDAYYERRRRWSLRAIQLENAEWTRSTLRRALAWVESALGLPVACYGLLNHVPAWLLISLTGLRRKLRKPARSREWAATVFIVFACYAGAVALANHWFGRSTAGYYAVTLPTSGLYLWRFAWLWQHQTRLLLQHLFAPTDGSRLRRLRKELIARVEAARNAYAETLGVAH
jgi:1-acyl-sn-glycerol-3-phosphate acyltransferase